MSKSNTAETNFLLLIFNNTNWANIGDATGVRGAATVGSLYLSLHTADPGETGNQGTNEISYTGYARQALTRTSGNFSVANGVMTLAVNVDFPEMTGGTGGTVTFFGVGSGASGATELLWSGSVSPTITVATGIIPRLKGTPSGTPSTVSED